VQQGKEVEGHRDDPPKDGNRFNGDLWLDIKDGPKLHAVKKNVEC
jgi:hypothetical protein